MVLKLLLQLFVYFYLFFSINSQLDEPINDKEDLKFEAPFTKYKTDDKVRINHNSQGNLYKCICEKRLIPVYKRINRRKRKEKPLIEPTVEKINNRDDQFTNTDVEDISSTETQRETDSGEDDHNLIPNTEGIREVRSEEKEYFYETLNNLQKDLKLNMTLVENDKSPINKELNRELVDALTEQIANSFFKHRNKEDKKKTKKRSQNVEDIDTFFSDF